MKTLNVGLLFLNLIFCLEAEGATCPSSPSCTYTATSGTNYMIGPTEAVCITSNYNSGTIYPNGGTIYVSAAGTITNDRIANSSPAAVTVTGASNASPISITAASHGFKTGDAVTIAGVGGNTAANGTWIIAYVDANTFTLNGTTGNGAFSFSGTAALDIKVTNATNASPIVITSSTHHLQTGQRVTIAGVSGNTAANNTYNITVLSSTTFSLNGSTGNGAYSSATTANATLVRSFTITNATNASPIVITTSTNHGFSTGDKVGIYGVLGNTMANGMWTVTKVSSTTFSLDNSTGNGAWTSGGTVQMRTEIINCGAFAGSTIGRYNQEISNYANTTIPSLNFNEGGYVSNYNTTGLTISSITSWNSSAFIDNKSGGSVLTLTSIPSLPSGSGSYIKNRTYSTINFTGNVNLGGANAYIENHEHSIMNFNNTSATNLNLDGASYFKNWGDMNFYANGIGLNFNNVAGVGTNKYGGTMNFLGTNGEFRMNSATMYNGGTMTMPVLYLQGGNSLQMGDASVLRVTSSVTNNTDGSIQYAGSPGSCAYLNFDGVNSATNINNYLTDESEAHYCGPRLSTGGSTVNIAAASNTTPIRVQTSANHGLAVGRSSVYITGVVGNTNANGTWDVQYWDADEFDILGRAGNGAYVSGGTVNITTKLGQADADGLTGCIAPTCSNAVPLPVELLEFDAVSESTRVKVLWTTASEKNNELFIVERSADGIHYEVVGTVKGAGFSSNLLNYSWIDYEPVEGEAYYRITQKDFDGKLETFNPAAVHLNIKNNAWVICPNPSDNNDLYLRFNDAKTREGEVFVYDILGNELYDKKFKFSAGQDFLLMPAGTLASGLYLLKIYSGSEIKCEKLIIK